jgi:hypothetical protein
MSSTGKSTGQVESTVSNISWQECNIIWQILTAGTVKSVSKNVYLVEKKEHYVIVVSFPGCCLAEEKWPLPTTLINTILYSPTACN